MNKILEYITNKYTLIGILCLVVFGFIFNFGYQKGKGDIIIVHDTIPVVDTIIQTVINYIPAKPDTIIINNIEYKTYSSTYRMSREGYSKVWFLDSLKFFKWEVREPIPITITKHKYIKIPVIDYKTTILVGVGAFIAGGITGILIK